MFSVLALTLAFGEKGLCLTLVPVGQQSAHKMYKQTELLPVIDQYLKNGRE